MNLNRRNILKGVGIGLGATALSGVASYYYSVINHLKRQSLVIGGSTTVKRFIVKVTDAFSKKNESVDMLVDGGHSYAGLVALERGAIDIAMMSHKLTSSEDLTSIHNYLIGLEAIALVVNEKCPISNISRHDANKILEKKITNWRELGGPDVPISVFSREDGSTTKISIEEILLEGGSISEKIKELSSSKEMAQEIALDPYSFGYLSARNFGVGMKPLAIDGVEIDDKTIYLGFYPLVRELYLVLTDESSVLSKNFLDYTLSDEGQKILANSGVVRVR
jgi:phosphate transport system substrate-binding protein